jgi:hypothetical protein
MRGLPIVGDFDGDGLDDLGTWRAGNEGLQTKGQFQFDLALDGLTGDAERTIDFDLAGVFERPVSADMNGDGIDDLGLFVTRREGVFPEESGEWFFLVSDTLSQQPQPGEVNTLDHLFTPVPFGTDLFAQFGDENAMPLAGNFDPPVADNGGVVGSLSNEQNPLDTTVDGELTARDALVVINALGRSNLSQISGSQSAVASLLEGYRLDASGDGVISALDALHVINGLSRKYEAAEAESLVAAKPSWTGLAEGILAGPGDKDDDLLALLALDVEAQRVKLSV